MYKISEAAGKLNVETYVIFEKLLTHAELLKNHTQKVHSVSYVDDQGITIIKALIDGKDEASILAEMNGYIMNEREESSDDLVSVEAEITELDQDEVVDDIEIDEHDDWLDEEDFELIDQEKNRLRSEVSRLRQELIQYDSELKRLDDAITNYQILMREDVDYLIQLEEQLEKLIFRREISDNPKEESGGMFGFMRK